MTEVEVEISLGEIKGLYEYFLDSYRKEGLSVNWSIFVYKSLQLLSGSYEQVHKGEYNENNDPMYHEYGQKMNNLIRQYVDRDEQGNPIIEQGEPRITEMIVEFQKEQKKLDEEYKELVEKLEHKNEMNNKFLSQKVKIKMLKADKSEIPDKVPPIIVCSVLKDLQ